MGRRGRRHVRQSQIRQLEDSPTVTTDRTVSGINSAVVRELIVPFSFKMIRHLRESSNTNNPDRFKLLKGALERMSVDGLNRLNILIYRQSSILLVRTV